MMNGIDFGKTFPDYWMVGRSDVVERSLQQGAKLCDQRNGA